LVRATGEHAALQAHYQRLLLTTLAHCLVLRVDTPGASVKIVALDAEKSIEGVTHEIV
jgi:hypothetical protein